MAVEEKIDFSVLETELQAAIESDVRYWRENDAKLRAVEQRVATYDEFRNIVKAAHLKPLEKKELQNSLHGNKNIIWNTISTRDKVNSYAPAQQFVTKKEGTQLIPKTGVELTKQWRNLKPSDRIQFLKCVGVRGIEQLFISEVPVEVFGDILEALSLALPVDAASTVFYIRLLQSLTHTNKFNLNLQFLTSSEISTCKKLMDDLNDCFLNYEEYLRENGITEETLHDLQNKYVK